MESYKPWVSIVHSFNVKHRFINLTLIKTMGNLKQLKNTLKEILGMGFEPDIGSPVVKSEKINTNNAWGFGGKSGTWYRYANGFMYFSGSYSHRHTPDSSANEWRYLVNGELAPAKIISKPVQHIYSVSDSANPDMLPLFVGSSAEISEEDLKKLLQNKRRWITDAGTIVIKKIQ